jgi:HEAT repeat protein
MTRLLFVSTLLVLTLGVTPARAQFSFLKRSRPAPSQRVPELILMVKTDGEERRRAQAAEELREYDPKTYTEIVPVLVDVAQHDPRPNVRSEALASLAKLRPITAAAGQALEKAAAGDENWRVRLQAKSALMKYHLAGYAPSRPDGTAPGTPGRVTTQEPPLADPLPKLAEPPLADPTVPPVVTTPATTPANIGTPPTFTPPSTVAPPLTTPQF